MALWASSAGYSWTEFMGGSPPTPAAQALVGINRGWGEPSSKHRGLIVIIIQILVRCGERVGY
jgi:hypothetical protein